VFINTPITADSNGNIFFGFRVQGTAPAPLNTTQSGFARIDPNGNASYVLAGSAAADAAIQFDSHNSAPALSNDGSTLYVVVKSGSTEYYGYLLGLDAVTLATKYKVLLKDPRNGQANNAGIRDISTASPTVAPDGDVYFGKIIGYDEDTVIHHHQIYLLPPEVSIGENGFWGMKPLDINVSSDGTVVVNDEQYERMPTYVEKTVDHFLGWMAMANMRHTQKTDQL